MISVTIFQLMAFKLGMMVTCKMHDMLDMLMLISMTFTLMLTLKTFERLFLVVCSDDGKQNN